MTHVFDGSLHDGWCATCGKAATDAAHGGKRLGRPIEVVDPVRVSVRLSSDDYDHLDAVARASGRSVPGVIRDAVSVLKNIHGTQTMTT